MSTWPPEARATAGGGRGPAPARLILALALLAPPLGGCLDRWLDAPYVLASGLGPLSDGAATGRESVLVVGERGLVEIDGSGTPTVLAPEPAQAVTAHADRVILRQGDTLRWGPLPAPGAPFQPTATATLAGAGDLQAWYDEAVLVTTPAGLRRLDTTTGALSPFGPPLEGATAVGLLPERQALVVTAGGLVSVSETALRPVATPLPGLSQAGVDGAGRVWVVYAPEGAPVLARLDAAGPVTVARHLGSPVALQFGTGGLLLRDNAYLTDAAGSVDYVRVPGGTTAP